MEKQIKTYAIYSRWLAYELRIKGFKIIKTEINKFHPEFIVWLFKDSTELQQAIHQVTLARKL